MPPAVAGYYAVLAVLLFKVRISKVQDSGNFELSPMVEQKEPVKDDKSLHICAVCLESSLLTHRE